ncbi:hypothetical protein [Actinoplanes sp. G11-F43]|uniref:hypothetical protein n=1 Tax=Actinoplanes sp. G11-F43 TaxID=3424130 RepID=UPI003D35892A
MGLALAKAAAWGVAQLATRALDGGFDPELKRLLKLPDRKLYAEIARAENTDAAIRELLERARRSGRPVTGRELSRIPIVDEEILTRQGRAAFERLLPKARALICPHRARILAAADSPVLDVVATVCDQLTGGVAASVVKPLAVLVVRHGLPALCDRPATAG